MIDDLLAVLALMDEPPTAQEVADSLWLAAYLPERPSARAGPGRPAARADDSDPIPRGPGPPDRPGPARTGLGTSPGASVHLPATGGDREAGGWPMSAPAAPAIRTALAIARALRPLNRCTVTRGEVEVDEDATADAVADTGAGLVRWRPVPEHWLEVALVFDDSPSMAVWQRTAAEFQAILEQQGAFRDVRGWRLSRSAADGRLLLDATGSAAPRDPRDLVAPPGRRLVLIISDCIDPAWADGRMAVLLEAWGRAHSVAVIQPLPQRLWNRARARLVPVYLRTAQAGTPNSGLGVRLRSAPDGNLAHLGVPVPVVELEARWLRPWAGLVAGAQPGWSPSVAIFSRMFGAEPAPPDAGTAATGPLDQVLQFRASASPTAFRLASLLAATPLNLPLMRVIQQVMLPRSGSGHLAEVFLSGLLCDPGPAGPSVVQVGAEFRPGVRELLLSGLTRTEVLRVWTEVSRFVSRRLGSTLDFRALLGASTRGSRAAAGEPFAAVALHVLGALGGSYAAMIRNPADLRSAAAADVEPAAGPGRLRPPKPRSTFPSIASGEAVTSSHLDQSGRPDQSRGEPPAIMGGVPIRNPNFTGREQLLLDLRAQLGLRTSVLLPQALHGLGGVGKTQLAVEYVHRFATDYELVWWISAEQSPLIRSSLAELGQRLGLADEEDTTKTIASVLEALRTGQPYRRWILIFDNADSPDAVEQYLPYPTGHILVTSRNPAWSAKAQALEVDVFPREESIQFIRQRGRDISVADADHLAEALGDLPLALEQAAVWQRETNMPIPEYLQLLSERMHELLSENSPVDYPQPVAATWGLALDQLTQQWPSAAELLRLCAFFSPEPIAERVLTAGRTLNLHDQLGRALRDPLEFSRAKREIGRYALARTNPGEKTIQVHRLVQAILRDQLTEDQRTSYRNTVHQLMYAADPGDPDYQENWERLAEISNHVFGSGLISAESYDGRQVVLDLIRYRYERGDYQSCRELGEATVLRWWEMLGPDHEQTLVALRDLANAWRALGMTTEAREYTRDTLQRMRRVFGEDHEHTLNTARGYAADLRNLGDYPAARELDEEILPKYRRVFGEDHMQTLRCANNLGVDLRLSGDFYAARDLDQDTLERCRRNLGPAHKDSLRSATQLIRDLRGCGRYRDAFALHSETMPIWEARLGPEHPDVIVSRLGAAFTLRRMGRYQDARTEAEQCLKLYRNRFGERHQTTITAMTILGEILRCLGDLDNARQLSEPAAELARRVYESDNIVPYLFDNNLAMILRAQGDYRAALALDDAARQAILADRGPDHNYALCVTGNLASDYSMAGDHERARELDADTAERSALVRHPDHPLTLGCQANLALDLRALGQAAAADGIFAEVMSQLDIEPGSADPEVVSVNARKRLQFDIEPPSL